MVHEPNIPALELPAREAPLHAHELGLADDGFPGELQQLVDVAVRDARAAPAALTLAMGSETAAVLGAAVTRRAVSWAAAARPTNASA
jgi:hypothetical protein